MLTNTATTYGTLARSLHWLTALLILSAVALGLYAVRLPTGSDAEAAVAIRIFSLHKTIGIAAFAVAAVRILWALIQPHPAPLHPDRRLETLAAATVHWALYAAMLVLPLSGWVHHAAAPGFSPILWPFGQGLAFVAPSDAIARAAQSVHHLAGWVLYAALGLHVLGALKHQLIDRDATLARMTRGVAAGAPAANGASVGAPVLALLLWAGVIGYGGLSPQKPEAAADAAATQAAATAGNWRVESGTLAFSVRQMGSPVSGTFPDWTAEITFDEQTGTGTVEVSIDTTTLALGAVSDEAKGPEFFDVATHPNAVFRADIAPQAEEYLATGTLTLRGVDVPVTLPFKLDLVGDVARMDGGLTLDRRDFGMGASYGDEATVGFAVDVQVTLEAARAN